MNVILLPQTSSSVMDTLRRDLALITRNCRIDPLVCIHARGGASREQGVLIFHNPLNGKSKKLDVARIAYQNPKHRSESDSEVVVYDV